MTLTRESILSGRRPAARRCLALLLLASAPAWADPGYYVQTAYDHDGALNLELRYWTVKWPGRPALLWPEVGVGYGVNSRWTTLLLASWIGTADTAQRLSSLNWQNQVLLTQGEYPVDAALALNLVRLQQPRVGHALEWGVGLQTDATRTQINANLLFERNVDTATPPVTRLKYQWQLRHRWQPGLHLGVQGFGELGPWADWAPRDGQSHRAGPAVFGTLGRDPQTPLEWQAALLRGTTNGRHGTMFSLRINYVR